MVILAALGALTRANLLNDRTITAYFTGDEEKSGKPVSVSRGDFISRAKNFDIALAFETAQDLHTVVSARRGASHWTLRTTAQQAHSAGVFSGNFGAVYEAVRIINEFREQLAGEKYLSINPAFLAGGSELKYDSAQISAALTGKLNIISPVAVAQGDLRFLSEEQLQKARQTMKKITASGNLGGTTAVISFEDGLPAMSPTKGNMDLVETLNGVSMDLGIGSTMAGDPGSRGAGDISWIAKYLDCLDGLGASGKGAHAPGETIRLDELPLLIERAAVLIYRLTR
jgi:glutamate carboxypeptidase